MFGRTVDLAQRLLRPGHDDPVGLGEALAGGQLGAGVGDDHVEAERLGEAGQRLGDVDRPEDQQRRRRREGLEEHLDRFGPAGDLVWPGLGPFRVEQLAGVGGGAGVERRVSEGAGGALGQDEQLGAERLAADDRRHGDRRPAIEGVLDLVVNLAVDDRAWAPVGCRRCGVRIA